MGLSCQLSSTCPSITKAMSMHFRESKWRFRVAVAVCAIGEALEPVESFGMLSRYGRRCDGLCGNSWGH